MSISNLLDSLNCCTLWSNYKANNSIGNFDIHCNLFLTTVWRAPRCWGLSRNRWIVSILGCSYLSEVFSCSEDFPFSSSNIFRSTCYDKDRIFASYWRLDISIRLCSECLYLATCKKEATRDKDVYSKLRLQRYSFLKRLSHGYLHSLEKQLFQRNTTNAYTLSHTKKVKLLFNILPCLPTISATCSELGTATQ